jgi:MoaA/NifB/PqqE/SkfB family radical SAM enzyme
MNDKLRFLFDHGMLLDPDRIGPYSVEIDPTNHCPINCAYCIWSQMRKRNLASLQEDVFRKLIDDLIRLRVSGIVFTGGGEPLSHPFTRKAIVRAKAGGIDIGLFTSGVPLGKRLCSQILPCLSWIRFNLSAPDPESYLQIHKVDLFDYVVKNITNCISIRNDHNLKVKLGIGSVLSRIQRGPQMIEPLTDLAARIGLDFIQFKHDLNEMGTAEYEDWWVTKALPELRSVTQAHRSKIMIEYSENTYGRPVRAPCFIARKMAAVKADGTVCVCKLHRDTPSMVIGNINETSFRDIWLNAQRKEIITMLEQKGCGTCCAYKGFNAYALNAMQTKDRYESSSTIPYETGIKRFGKDINFL